MGARGAFLRQMGEVAARNRATAHVEQTEGKSIKLTQRLEWHLYRWHPFSISSRNFSPHRVSVVTHVRGSVEDCKVVREVLDAANELDNPTMYGGEPIDEWMLRSARLDIALDELAKHYGMKRDERG